MSDAIVYYAVSGLPMRELVCRLLGVPVVKV